MHGSTVSFGLHILIESFAALSFIVNPDAQLPGASPAATLILRQYGGLLLSSNFICAALLTKPFDSTTRLVCASLAFFHLWPTYRASSRLNNPGLYGDDTNTKQATLGGPKVHLAVHSVCCILFTAAALTPSN